jgi:thioesterase domain-containing protein
MLDPVLERFLAQVGLVTLRAPRIPYITNVTGTWVTAQQATDPAHWVRHMRQTVRFAEGLDVLLQDPDGIYLEVGPGQTFSAILKRHPRKDGLRLALPTLASAAHPSDHAAVLAALGQLWEAQAAAPAWHTLHAIGARRRVPLPVYPFDRHRYWPQAAAAQRSVAAAAAPASTVAAPRCEDELEHQVARAFAEALGLDAVAPEDDFFDLGGSSLSALGVLIDLERIAGRALSNGLLLENRTVRALARALRGDARADARLVGLRPGSGAAPIFCIHPYGGHTTGYVELARHLGADQPVYGVQARGLQGESTPLRTIEAMAADYIALIKSRQPSGPYRLAGHSMGGCIAYEMAQQLTRAGDGVELLALFDSRAQNASERPLYRNSAYGRMASRDWLSDEAVMLGILFPKLEMDWESLRDRPAGDHRDLAQDAIVRQGLLPAGTGHAQVRHLLAVTEANDEALRSYRPQAYAGQVLLFCGTEGFAPQFGEPDLGWGALAKGGLELVMLPGDHHSVMTGASAQAMARRLAQV